MLHRLSTACALIGAGFAVSACSTAQEPTPLASSEMTPVATETVTTQSVAVPGYIDCIGAPLQKPTVISLKCSDDSLELVDIEWSHWSEDGARGRGTLVSVDEPGQESRTPNHAVALSDPFLAPPGLVFTRITLDEQPMQP
ncbi:hypothetical protein [Corynebacterium epidermidicanis]|uniref:Secreted protein n=1 Tax=Corynebacterium epidermidicanis TaxID=1050174 RepID=A0A0G3GNM1_9CORY|nr:hypothetical protein [Corynebacterium epidermidicanis]AKK02744.1 hypothetical protein CEPID_04365 [Corynebacterium epidermidicanis]